jgi:hypothetical protein
MSSFLPVPDPHPEPADPDPYPFHPNVSKAKCQYTVKKINNYETYDAAQKDKTMKNGTAVNKSI